MSAGQRKPFAPTLIDGAHPESRPLREPRVSVAIERERRHCPPDSVARDGSPMSRAGCAQAHGGRLRGQLEPVQALLPQPLQLGADETIPLLGVSLPLRWSRGHFVAAQRDGDAVRLQLPDGADARMARLALREFYLAQAQAWLGPVLARWLPHFSAPAPRAVRIRPLRSLWGSLSPDNRVSLDLALVLAPPAAFEYVLLHELCHLRHRHHRPTFWRAVARCCPDHPSQRAWLRAHGLTLKAQCQRLTADVP